jgi:predicted acyltransferase
MEPTQKRLTSLDAFRGATIAAMILVNDPGSWKDVYPQLRHAQWNGWTFTDWIFPFFLFIVGVAMPFSFSKRLEAGGSPRALITHIFRRAAVIFALGLVVNGFPFWLDPTFSLATFRIPGVLQRIAICYLVASFIFIYGGIKAQVWGSGLLLAAYWLLVRLVPVPGFGAGVLEPTGSLQWYVDSTLLKGHTWVYAPAPGFDPEGIIGTIPAIATTLIGTIAGHWLRSSRTGKEKASWMFVVGSLMVLVGVILDRWLPINKNLWTSSYVVFIGGWSLSCLATLYWLIDVKQLRRWATPFIIFGMNAIATYVLAELLAVTLGWIQWGQAGGVSISLQQFLFLTFFASWVSPVNASLLFAITYVLVMFLFAWVLWKKRWFVKV